MAFVSLGCSKNLTDTEAVMTRVRNSGFDITAEEEGADAVVLNTCAFLDSAAKESLAEVDRLSAAKKKGRIAHLSVIGCFPTRFGASPEHPGVDAWLPIVREAELPALLAQKFGVQAPCTGGRVRATPRHTAYLKISEGCNHVCTFCAIPSIRGKMKSRTLQELMTEARELAAGGVAELNLVAEDSTDWGRDIFGKPALHLLLEELAKVQGLRWIRLLYAYPSKVSPEVIRILGQGGPVLPYLDMPIQHASDSVLAAMKRAYRRKDLEGLVSELRNRVPDITLRTTLITGFPGESDRDFRELEEFLEQHPFDRIGVFAYSPEPGTAAERLPKRVPEKAVADRLFRLRKLQDGLSRNRLKALVGRTLETVGEGEGFGRTLRDAPEVDGKIEAPGLRGGHFARVTVSSASTHDLRGTLEA